MNRSMPLDGQVALIQRVASWLASRRMISSSENEKSSSVVSVGVARLSATRSPAGWTNTSPAPAACSSAWSGR
jgi:hypothetical protein